MNGCIMDLFNSKLVRRLTCAGSPRAYKHKNTPTFPFAPTGNFKAAIFKYVNIM